MVRTQPCNPWVVVRWIRFKGLICALVGDGQFISLKMSYRRLGRTDGTCQSYVVFSILMIELDGIIQIGVSFEQIDHPIWTLHEVKLSGIKFQGKYFSPPMVWNFRVSRFQFYESEVLKAPQYYTFDSKRPLVVFYLKKKINKTTSRPSMWLLGSSKVPSMWLASAGSSPSIPHPMQLGSATHHEQPPFFSWLEGIKSKSSQVLQNRKFFIKKLVSQILTFCVHS